MRNGDLTMRERTTWNRDQITTAAKTVTADPYAMNQDHLQQQPRADKYLTGDPSTFAEDVTEPNTWDREYAGGTTERNEIGEPAFRPETFNHAEKSASVMDEKTLVKKADLCTSVARMMLRGHKFATEAAQTEAIESQAVALMYMPNADLINTASRLAAQEDFPGGQTWPSQFAGDQQQQQQGQSQQQQAVQQQQAQYQQAVQQCMQAMQEGDPEKAQQAIQQMVQQAARYHQAKRAAEEGQQQQGQQGQQQQAQTQPVAQQEGQQQQQGQGQQQQQGAEEGQQQGQQGQMDQQALEAMLAEAGIAAVQAADYDAKKGPAINPPGYGPYTGPQAGGMKTEKTAAEEGQQQQGQGQGQQQQQAAAPPVAQSQQQVQQGQSQQQQQQGQSQQQADDQLLDDMLMGPQAAGGMSEVDIEMEPSQMDMSDVVLSATDDEVLRGLFANEETADAQAAQAAAQQKQGGMSRTASSNPSTRTLGTRPTGGVSKVGGAPAPQTGGSVDALTALWPSAPDVREAFNIR